jgi:signal transduction histidine kinase
MRRLKAFFQGLTWQLIVSYLIVTLAVTVSLQVLVVLGSLFQDAKGESVTPAQILEKQAGTQVTPFLGQPNPDREALQYLAVVPLFSALKQADAHLTLVMILDGNGQSLASGACTQTQLLASGSQACFATAAQQAAALQALPAVQDAVRGALNGSRDAAGVSSLVVDGHTILTVPVIGGQKHLAGALLATFSGVLNPSPSPALRLRELTTALAAAYWDRWQLTWLYFLLLAVAIGAFTGFLASRRLTRRLQRLMLAANAWSRGEFQTEVQDRASDEVGQLARDLNSMAGEVQSLLASRQLLAALDERNRLARDLHDTVKQQVFSSALLVHAARRSFDKDPVVARQHLEESEALHEKIQAALVEALQALKPAAVTDKGLADILREYVDAW